MLAGRDRRVSRGYSRASGQPGRQGPLLASRDGPVRSAPRPDRARGPGDPGGIRGVRGRQRPAPAATRCTTRPSPTASPRGTASSSRTTTCANERRRRHTAVGGPPAADVARARTGRLGARPRPRDRRRHEARRHPLVRVPTHARRRSVRSPSSLIGLLGREVGGDRVGLVAAAFAAVYPNLWVNDGLVMAETFTALFAALVLYLAYRYRRIATPLAAVGLGAACGFAALARSEMILLAPCIVLPILLSAGSLAPRAQAPGQGRRRRARRSSSWSRRGSASTSAASRTRPSWPRTTGRPSSVRTATAPTTGSPPACGCSAACPTSPATRPR